MIDIKDGAVIAYIDGSSFNNPGPSGIGIAIQYPDGNHEQLSEFIGEGDNNRAEYAALLKLLVYAVAKGIRKLHVNTDSEVVANQISGTYQCRHRGFVLIYRRCKRKIQSLSQFEISHVPRAYNKEANALAQNAVLRELNLPLRPQP